MTPHLLPDGVRVVRTVGVADILNDEFVPSLPDASVVEGDAGSTDLTFTLTSALPNPAACDITVPTVLDGTATAADLTPVDQVITVQAGATTVDVRVAVTGDVIDEADETFHLHLTGTPDRSVMPCGRRRHHHRRRRGGDLDR